jgi:hypothetical protein
MLSILTEVLKNKVVAPNLDWNNAVWSGVILQKVGDNRESSSMFFADTEISITASVVSGFLKISMDLPPKHRGQFRGISHKLKCINLAFFGNMRAKLLNTRNQQSVS